MIGITCLKKILMGKDSLLTHNQSFNEHTYELNTKRNQITNNNNYNNNHNW